jgi:hypothetical protein
MVSSNSCYFLSLITVLTPGCWKGLMGDLELDGRKKEEGWRMKNG